MFQDSATSELRVYMNALLRVLDLKGEVSESTITSAVGEDALRFLDSHREFASRGMGVSKEAIEKAEKEEAIRARLRESGAVEEIEECITEAELLGMSFEASLGRRKLLKLFPVLIRD